MIEELRDKELTDIKCLRARMTGNVGLALDHAYNLGFFDGKKSVVDKIRAEIEAIIGEHRMEDYDFCSGLIAARKIIDKYKTKSEAEIEGHKSTIDNLTNGDVIKALFPNAKFDNAMPFTDGRWETMNLDTKDKTGAIYKPTQLRTCADWWNAPYKQKEREYEHRRSD